MNVEFLGRQITNVGYDSGYRLRYGLDGQEFESRLEQVLTPPDRSFGSRSPQPIWYRSYGCNKVLLTTSFVTGAVPPPTSIHAFIEREISAFLTYKLHKK
jgi:hypothetical protein